MTSMKKTVAKSKSVKTTPDFTREQALLSAGLRSIAGVDEVGRGPLAGPVVAAAVILDPDHLPSGLNDSKTLSAARRDALYLEIMRHAHVAVASVPAPIIDRINIRQATLLAMTRAVNALSVPPDHVLVDGRDVPPLPCSGEALIGGDGKSLSIAAASIIAKVTRDRLMERLSAHDPRYGFAAHAGYGTAMHLAALELHGPSPYHRMSFAPLKHREPQDQLQDEQQD